MNVKPNKKTMATLTINNKDLEKTSIQQALTNITPQTPEHDSTLEQDFYDQLVKEQQHWEIKPQQVIFHEDIIYVPDFLATHKHSQKQVLIEVAGYYTQTYLKKKAQKLNQLSEHHDIIILTPQQNQQWFQEIKATVIPYKENRPLPWQRIIHALNTKYMPQTTANQVTKYLEENKNQALIPLKSIAEQLQTTTQQVHKQLQQQSKALQRNQQKYLSQVGVISQQTLQHLKKQLLEQKQKTPVIDYSKAEQIALQVISQLPKQHVTKLLNEVGAELVYQDLVNIQVDLTRITMEE